MDYRLRQYQRFFLTLAVVVGAYLAYALLAVPLIEGPQRVVHSDLAPNKFDLFQFKADLVKWLPADAWERQPCKQVSTRTGHLFFQEYLPYDDGRVEVRPLTIILVQAGAQAGTPPIILRAPEGAILKLDRPLTLGGDAVQMEGGQLPGPVTIFRAATQADRNDEWLIQTSQIQINKQKIQTLQDVDFRLGPHQGRGRNLAIEFETDPLRAQQPTMTGILGARRVELVQVDRLHLAVPAPPATDNSGLTPAAAGFDVTCDGPFEFDLATNIASLNDNVKIVSSEQADDWLMADQIALRLGDVQNTERSPESIGSASTPESLGQWSLQSIEAVGQPAVLNSGSRQILVRGERLKYALESQTVEVYGSRGAELRQGSLELMAASALYQITADGSLGAARIGGPGTIRRPAIADQPGLEIRWQDRLTIGTDEGRKRIDLLGDALVQIEGQSQLAAEQVQLWLWESPTAGVDPVENDAATPIASASQRSIPNVPRWSWNPDRLIATGRVQLDSARVTGAVDRLLAQWPRPDAMNALAATLPNTNVATSPRPAQVPYADQGLPSAIAPVSETPEPKVSVYGKTATIYLPDANSPAFRECVLEGDVRVVQNSLEGAIAWEITGQRLQINPQGEQKFRLSVSGSPETPSRVQAQSMQLLGHSVQLDQSANRLWIDGPGQMHAAQVLPRESNTSDVVLADAERSPRAPAEPTAMDVQWSGGMVFDGRQIYLESNVIASGEQPSETGRTRVETRSSAIKLSLTSFIDLSGATAKGPAVQPQIELLTLIGQIPDAQRVFPNAVSADETGTVELLRQSFGADQTMISLQKMSVPWGQVNSVNGQLNLSGPGSVSMWALGDGSGSFLAAQGSAGQTSRSASQISNTQILYETSLTGNIRQTEMLFAGKVRTLHGPVLDWDQRLDADRPISHADCYRLRSDQLQITQWQRGSAESAHVEIIALGQAQLEGETFEALAERIGYNQSQEKVILEGDPRNGAQVTYQTAPGGPRNPLVAGKIAFNLRDNTTQVEGFKHGVLTTGPIMKRR